MIRELDQSGNLPSFERPVAPLLTTAVVTVALPIVAHVYFVPGASR